LADLLFAAVGRSKTVTVQSVRPDKFAGRFDALVYANDTNVNDQMILDGYAVPWNGVGKKPIVPWNPPAVT
jgi:endonuclease YncB( thermonuclease family)